MARKEIVQATQAWIGKIGIVFARRDGDVAVLSVGGEQVADRVLRAEPGQTVDAGPFDITVTGFGHKHGRDTVHVVVSGTG